MVPYVGLAGSSGILDDIMRPILLILVILGPLPMVGANGYLGAWLEAGSAFDDWSDAAHQWNASGGFVLETFLGPFVR